MACTKSGPFPPSRARAPRARYQCCDLRLTISHAHNIVCCKVVAEGFLEHHHHWMRLETCTYILRVIASGFLKRFERNGAEDVREKVLYGVWSCVRAVGGKQWASLGPWEREELGRWRRERLRAASGCCDWVARYLTHRFAFKIHSLVVHGGEKNEGNDEKSRHKWHLRTLKTKASSRIHPLLCEPLVWRSHLVRRECETRDATETHNTPAGRARGGRRTRNERKHELRSLASSPSGPSAQLHEPPRSKIKTARFLLIKILIKSAQLFMHSSCETTSSRHYFVQQRVVINRKARLSKLNQTVFKNYLCKHSNINVVRYSYYYCLI